MAVSLFKRAGRLMRHSALGLTIVVASGCGWLGSGGETLATYSSPALLENLRVGYQGEVYLANYFAKTVEVWSQKDGAKTFATLPIHPVSLVELQDGLLVFGHGAPFNQGPAFQTMNAMVRINRTGQPGPVIPVPEARFLNGCTPLGPDRVLVADSIQGVIWQLNLQTNRLSLWFNSIELRPVEGSTTFKPGANGVQFSSASSQVYISNSSTGRIWRIAVGPNGRPQGQLQSVTTLTSVDDFAVDFDGTIYAASHEKEVWRIRPAGTPFGLPANPYGFPTPPGQQLPEEKTVLVDNLAGPTAVAIGITLDENPNAQQQKHLYIVTSGNVLTGGTSSAQFLRVPLGPVVLPAEVPFDTPTIPSEKPRAPGLP